MKVKATRIFRDLKEEVLRKESEEFIITKERFEEINEAGHGLLVEEVKEVKKKKK